MLEKIIDRLVSIKSIVTLVLTVVFAYLSVVGVVEEKDFWLGRIQRLRNKKRVIA